GCRGSSISIAVACTSAPSPVSARHAWSTSMCPSTRGSRRPMVSDSLLPLAGRTVLGIFAHPDDESLACGGTLARLADAGARVILLCASRGERGTVSDPALVPDDGDLGAVRVAELHEAAKVLGIAEVMVCDHGDGNLRWNDVD